MRETVNAWLDSHRDELVNLLKKWVMIPSVKGEAEPGAPFGREVGRMMKTAAADLREMGFAVREFEGYACDASIGPDGPEDDPIAVLGHLDVVPAGDGWTLPPFGAVEQDGKIFGRGTNDDKGPALCAALAMQAIRETGVPLKRGIRLILGGDEESGWEDMDYYARNVGLPDNGFSPDANFPLINTEKGMLMLALRGEKTESGLRILELASGERPNVIPGECKALVAGGEETAEKVRALAAEWQLPYRAETTEKGVMITAEGIPGHSAHPDGRRNANGMMLKMLKALGAEGAIAVLAEKVGMESDGKTLGVAGRDEVSGPLTCNLGILRLEENGWYATLDFRCPITADLKAIRKTVTGQLAGWTAGTIKETQPHHVPPESELVRELLAAYEEETGWKGEAMATGGGTYAKVMKQGVAFGALFPDEEELAHQANEYESIDRLMLAAKIYANALMRLCV